MRFGSVCSGIEAATVAWQPLGWQAAWLSEIASFSCAVLAHHYPAVPNHGDMTSLPARITAGEVEAPDVFTGGTPCQAFSVAGKRGSLDDARGNLSLTFCEIANAIDDVRHADGREPSIIIWENVPGVFSTADNAFGCFLGALAGSGCELQPAGGKWTNSGLVLGPRRAIAWRTLDAQYFGLAQRRRRVFLVASARNGFDPAAVLFERDGLRRDSAPSREAREVVTGSLSARTSGGGGLGTDLECDGGLIPDVTGSLTASAGGSDENDAVNGRIVPELARCIQTGEGKRQDWETCTIIPAIAFQSSQSGVRTDEVHATLDSNNGSRRHNGALLGMSVRRLTPIECERLQGFPDNYTRIPRRKKPAFDCVDGPRYQAIGNSWAVPCAAWIGKRIATALEFQIKIGRPSSSS